jgi:hypothetical protein
MTTLRLATRSSAQATAQAEGVAAALGPRGVGRAGVRRDHRRPAPRRAAAHHRRAGRVRQGGAAGGARRSRRPGGALGQGPAVHPAPTGLTIGAFCERRSPADALIGQVARRAARGRHRRHRLGASPRAARRRCAPTWLRRSSAATSRPGCPRLPEGGAIVMAVAALEILGSPTGSPRSSTRPCSCPPSVRGVSPSSAATTMRPCHPRGAAIDHSPPGEPSRWSERSSPSSVRAVRCRSAPTSTMACCTRSSVPATRPTPASRPEAVVLRASDHADHLDVARRAARRSLAAVGPAMTQHTAVRRALARAAGGHHPRPSGCPRPDARGVGCRGGARSLDRHRGAGRRWGVARGGAGSPRRVRLARRDVAPRRRSGRPAVRAAHARGSAVRTAAVGTATADVLAQHLGRPVDLVPDVQLRCAGGLARAVPQPAGGFSWPRPTVPGRRLVEGLTELGHVEVRTAYVTRLRDARAPRGRRVPSTPTPWRSPAGRPPGLGRRRSGRPPRRSSASIGPTTEQAARRGRAQGHGRRCRSFGVGSRPSVVDALVPDP